MEAAGAAATKFTFAGGSTTDTLVEQAGPLGNILIDTAGGTAGTAASSQDGVYYSSLNYVNSTLQMVKNPEFSCQRR